MFAGPYRALWICNAPRALTLSGVLLKTAGTLYELADAKIAAGSVRGTLKSGTRRTYLPPSPAELLLTITNPFGFCCFLLAFPRMLGCRPRVSSVAVLIPLALGTRLP